MSGNKTKEEKIKLLRNIPGDGLVELAEMNEISKNMKNKELIDILSDVAEYELIKSVYKQFKDAGRSTINLFQLRSISEFKKKENLEKLRGELNKLTKENSNALSKFKVADVKILEQKKLKINLESKGKKINEIDAETKEIIDFYPLVKILIIIHLNDGLVEIRTRDHSLANLTCAELSKIICKVRKELNEEANCLKHIDIKFNENELDKIIEWASKFRNATMKSLSGGISSLRMTASEDSDLREENLYSQRDDILGTCERTGIYVQFDSKVNERTRNIGFQINAKQGKLHFKTQSREMEIDSVLEKIKEIKGLNLKEDETCSTDQKVQDIMEA
ncbi:hypothetical protein [Methanobacterium formicicum]|uniref:Uncharacterized protein n=1 Tax=Methanobacterium formicicum (strain DSM 3637 / PP1) TaxID=1204725 RepID=K2RDX6_METFP|nr:hypothetical protein [Methanobacterium formicicum]EKF86554.1 hypothetical protein A994_03688 [Methanobacterium formicicum DSM 3637]